MVLLEGSGANGMPTGPTTLVGAKLVIAHQEQALKALEKTIARSVLHRFASTFQN